MFSWGAVERAPLIQAPSGNVNWISDPSKHKLYLTPFPRILHNQTTFTSLLFQFVEFIIENVTKHLARTHFNCSRISFVSKHLLQWPIDWNCVKNWNNSLIIWMNIRNVIHSAHCFSIQCGLYIISKNVFNALHWCSQQLLNAISKITSHTKLKQYICVETFCG